MSTGEVPGPHNRLDGGVGCSLELEDTCIGLKAKVNKLTQEVKVEELERFQAVRAQQTWWEDLLQEQVDIFQQMLKVSEENREIAVEEEDIPSGAQEFVTPKSKVIGR